MPEQDGRGYRANVIYAQGTRLDGPEKAYSAFRTIYVLLGGTGMKVGLRLRKRILEAFGTGQLPFQQFLWLDTDARDLDGQKIGEEPEMERRLRFQPDDYINLTLPHERIREFLANPSNHPWLWEWMTQETLINLGNNAQAVNGAAQMRAIGRLAFTNRFEEFRQKYTERIGRLRQPGVADEAARQGFQLEQDAIEVVLICSLAGGTGSGSFLEAARWMKELTGADNVRIGAYLMLPSVFEERVRGMPDQWMDIQANAYAALQELNDIAARAYRREGAMPLWIGRYSIDRAVGFPFDEAFLVDAENDRQIVFDSPKDEDAYDMVADALFCDFDRGPFGTKKRSHRCNVRPHLLSTSQLYIPVDDGNAVSAADRPLCVFQFPNAFGALGMSRIPFERSRLRRAGAAWLSGELLRLLVREREVSDQTAVEILRERGADLVINADRLLDRLLDDGQGHTFYAAVISRVAGQVETLRREIERWMDIRNRAPRESLDQLVGANAFGRSVRSRLVDIFNQAMDQVDRDLRSTGPEEMLGDHVRAIRQRREQVDVGFQESLRAFVHKLLADPKNFGLGAVNATLRVLERQLRGLAEQRVEVPARPSVGELSLDAGRDVAQVYDMLSEARSLILPVYSGLAEDHFQARSEVLVVDAASATGRQARTFLDSAVAEFDSWVRRRYQAAAVAQSGVLFRTLADRVGSRVEVRGDNGAIERVEASGQRERMRLLQATFESTGAYFRQLENSYRNVGNSRRNGEDLGRRISLADEVLQTLRGSTPRYDDDGDDLVLNAWKDLLREAKILKPGQQDLLVGGIEVLVDAAAGVADQDGPWRDIRSSIEQWTVGRLSSGERPMLAGRSAMTMLREGNAATQLTKINDASGCWLPFRARYGTPGSLQEKGFLGTDRPDAGHLTEWRQGARDLGTVDVTQHDSGSILLYREKMAFPLYVVRGIEDLESAYREHLKARPTRVPLRHTVRDPLDLPPLLPPDQDDATDWFLTDRLALEAVILDVFRLPQGRDDSREVEFKYFDRFSREHVRRSPRSLRAIAAHMRANRDLRTAILEEVRERTRRALSNIENATAAVALTGWYMNRAFPLHPVGGQDGDRYLEHELASSISVTWQRMCENQGMDQESLRVVLRTDMDLRSGHTAVSPVTSTAMRVDALRCLRLQPRIERVDPPTNPGSDFRSR